MQSYPILLKIVVLSSFILLMASLVAYRSGSFDSALGRVEYEQGDSTIPDSLLPPKFIHSSKSMAPIFKETLKISPLDSPIIESIPKDDIRAESSKSGRVFSGDDFYIEDVRILKLDVADSTKPEKKKKKRKKRKRKQMMTGSKSAAVISPQ